LINFEETWLKDFRGWVEGVAHNIPCNNQIKANATFRNRLPLNQFLDVVEHNIVETCQLIEIRKI
jgi:hypothetical protein